ncbi:hypothetical protein B0H67DRAFT_551676 [Lasiosphaeris hirsuta]|uniref:Uncharacterized protein n=1 Tax=Lasiosphaeris hirsuta TaxID=260670 RepID=A0AA40DWT7_9PEZI|nr:hypothetical protein B0H67DRAFT_551676 [Lasiosphaeris hirsuta]
MLFTKSLTILASAAVVSAYNTVTFVSQDHLDRVVTFTNNGDHPWLPSVDVPAGQNVTCTFPYGWTGKVPAHLFPQIQTAAGGSNLATQPNSTSGVESATTEKRNTRKGVATRSTRGPRNGANQPKAEAQATILTNFPKDTMTTSTKPAVSPTKKGPSKKKPGASTFNKRQPFELMCSYGHSYLRSAFSMTVLQRFYKEQRKEQKMGFATPETAHLICRDHQNEKAANNSHQTGTVKCETYRKRDPVHLRAPRLVHHMGNVDLDKGLRLTVGDAVSFVDIVGSAASPPIIESLPRSLF